MKVKPGSAELLQLARRILRQQLMEHIPQDKKYQALMIANAMSIAARELDSDAEKEREELSRLGEILGENPDTDTSKDVQSALENYYRRLSMDIRAGRIDPGSSHYLAVYDLLCDQTRQKVMISNPGYLEAADR